MITGTPITTSAYLGNPGLKVSRSLFAVVYRNSYEIDSLTSTTQRPAYRGFRPQWFDQFEEPAGLVQW